MRYLASPIRAVSFYAWIALCGCLLTGFLSGGADAQNSRISQYTIDVSQAERVYANFFRVTGTPEEMIIDLGLNPQAKPTSKPIVIDQRLILSYYNAKRLQAALETSVKRHEQLFGELETDIQKRLQQNQKNLRGT